MLSKHTLLYFLGRGLPGIVNFFAISIYTRLLLPSEYGKYAIVFATVTLLVTILYQWLRLVLLRFLPSCNDDDSKSALYASIGVGYLLSVLISIVLLVIYYLTSTTLPFNIVAFGLVLLWTQSLFEIGLEYFRANLKAKEYTIANFLKSIFGIVVGCLLAYYGFGAVGLVLGLVFATVLCLFFFLRKFIGLIFGNVRSFNILEFRKHLKYGLPLTMSFAMSFIVNSSDRYFINHYIGISTTGVYSVGYDLAKQTLWMIMMSINLASYPLVIRALEKEGIVKAKMHLSQNLTMLLAVSLPASLGLALLALPISKIIVGKLYVNQVAMIIPLISIGAFIGGIKTFYLDQSYQLSHKTHLQLYSVGIAALSNIILNFAFIPTMGVMGAVYSSLICYIIDFCFSVYISRKAFILPVSWKDVVKISLSCVMMSIVIISMHGFFSGTIGLAFIIFLAILVYCACILVSKVFKIDTSKLSFGRRNDLN